MLQVNVSIATENKDKPILYSCQGKNKALLDSTNFFDRVCSALGIPNVYGAKAKVAEITGISKTAVGLWDKGEMPGKESLQNLARISELSGTSLHWLLTGEGEKEIDPQKTISFDEIFENKIREIVQEEVAKQIQKERGRPSLQLNLNNPDEDRNAA